MHFSSRSETAGLACFRQASRSRWLSSGLLSGMMAGELGGLPSAGGPVWTIAGWALRGGFPPGPGRGIQAFSRRKPGRKESRGVAPRPPFFRARSLALAGFGGCAALFRSIGYYEPHLRALIWRLSFAKFFFSIFFLENASQIGLSIPEVIAPRPYQSQLPQNQASGNERP